MLARLESVCRSTRKNFACSVENAAAKTGTLIAKVWWWGVLVLGKALGQHGIVEQSDQLQVTHREKGLNYYE